jgi:DNA-binding NarL/FixJ family response regulator
MSIKLLLVDGSDVMRSGTATSFAETIALTAALKPDVLLMDPHMPDEREYKPAFVKSQILSHTKCIVAISLWKDADTKTFG